MHPLSNDCIPSLEILEPRLLLSGTPAFSELVVFGDSLSDTGNTSQWAWAAGYYPSDNRCTSSEHSEPPSSISGVWHEHLATLLGLPSAAHSDDGGSNYAHAGAVTTSDSVWKLVTTIDNTGKQVFNYLNNNTPTDEVLYALWAGGNDLMDAAKAMNDDSIEAAAVLDTAHNAANNLQLQVALLADAGATHIVWPNLPSLDTVPQVVVQGFSSATITTLKQAVTAFNTSWSTACSSLQSMHPQLRIYTFDIYSTFATMLTGQYDPWVFSDIAHQAHPNDTFSAEQTDRYLFWDKMHPTAKAHELLGLEAYSQFFDHDAPHVTTPAYAFTPGTDITVEFNEFMDSDSLSNATITLAGSSSGPHAFDLIYDAENRLLSIDPAVDFIDGEIVALSISQGATDRAGNALDGNGDGIGGDAYNLTFRLSSGPVQDSIDSGIDWLRSVQYSNGSWSNETATTSLAVLAMLNAGYEDTDPIVQKGLNYLLSQLHADGSMGSQSSRYTYRTGIGILPFVATHNPIYENTIRKMRDWLVGSQWDESCYYGSVTSGHPYYGGFGYGSHTRPDLSNTQWALLGIKAADRELGEDSSSTYRKASDYFLVRCQRSDGGSGYTPGQGSIHTMTAASVWSYRLCGVAADDSRVTRGLDWLGRNYSLYSNDGWGRRSDTYYWLTFGKSLVMSHKDSLNGHDWFPDLSNYMMDKQTSSGGYDGAWTIDGWLNGRADYELNTAYAVLAMQTKTLPPGEDVSLSIVLASHADLHVYDPDGRHLGVNYATTSLENEIPGASLIYYEDLNSDGLFQSSEQRFPVDYLDISTDWRQMAILPVLVEGSYRTELVGTSDGPFDLMILGLDDGQTVTSSSYQGTITDGQRYSTSTTVTAMEGPITLLYEELDSLPLMDVTPDTIEIFAQAGQVAEVTFTVSETGGDEILNGVSIFCSDLTGPGGTIDGSGVTFTPNHFDVSAGDSTLVTAYISVSAGFTGTATGEIIVESTDGGTQTVSISLSTAYVDVSIGRCAYDRRTGRFCAAVTATNVSDMPSTNPWLVITDISDASVSLLDPDGITPDGDPYVDLSALITSGTLEPGESVNLMLYFDNPARMIFSFDAEVQQAIAAARLVPDTASQAESILMPILAVPQYLYAARAASVPSGFVGPIWQAPADHPVTQAEAAAAFADADGLPSTFTGTTDDMVDALAAPVTPAPEGLADFGDPLQVSDLMEQSSGVTVAIATPADTEDAVASEGAFENVLETLMLPSSGRDLLSLAALPLRR